MRVYPACAGIDHYTSSSSHAFGGLPRMRGNRPAEPVKKPAAVTFTPHARGSTQEEGYSFLSGEVYPACAGIDRSLILLPPLWVRLPRMRGDRPSWARNFSKPAQFTPHARGSTRRQGRDYRNRRVYPACAGIDLDCACWEPLVPRLPRMRGDRPDARYGAFAVT